MNDRLHNPGPRLPMDRILSRNKFLETPRVEIATMRLYLPLVSVARTRFISNKWRRCTAGDASISPSLPRAQRELVVDMASPLLDRFPSPATHSIRETRTTSLAVVLLFALPLLPVFFGSAVHAQAPTITSISPSTATAGSTGFTLTVNGTGFAAGRYSLRSMEQRAPQPS